MNYLSLFSGIGGFDLALRRLGWTCAGMCEIDKQAQGVSRHQFPGVAIFDDVHNVGVKTHARNSVDLIVGGFPCQDVSIAGRRAGLAGERSGLWHQFARIIGELAPRWVLIENVTGLLSSNQGRDFGIIVSQMVECGYGVAWRVLDAQYFGVPQRRRRVFIVGSLGDGRAAQVLFEREGGGGYTLQGGKAGQDIAHSVATSTYRYDPNGGDYVIGSLQSHSRKHGHAMTTQQAAESGQLIVSGSLHSGTPGRDASDIVNGHLIPIIEQNNFASTPDMISLRANPAQPAILWNGVRRLMPVECERLQGFPDGWTDGQSDSARYRQLGNAVAVPPAEWLAYRLTNETP